MGPRRLELHPDLLKTRIAEVALKSRTSRRKDFGSSQGNPLGNLSAGEFLHQSALLSLPWAPRAHKREGGDPEISAGTVTRQQAAPCQGALPSPSGRRHPSLGSGGSPRGTMGPLAEVGSSPSARAPGQALVAHWPSPAGAGSQESTKGSGGGVGEGGRARQTPAARPCYHPGPAAAATKDPSTPASSPATAGGGRLSYPTPPPRGGGDNVTWSPGVPRSCQPQVHGLGPPPGSLRVDHHVPPGESNQNPQQRKRPTPVSPARSASLCVLLIPLQSLKAQAREPNPNRSRKSRGGGSSSNNNTRLLRGSRESAPRAHIQRSQVQGGWRGDREGARPARSPGSFCGARGAPAGSDQGLNLVRSGDLAELKSSGPGAAAAARVAKIEAAAAATGQRRPCAEGGRREREEEEEEGVRRQRRKLLPGGRLGLPDSGCRLYGSAAG